jgi:3-hydroxyacyl-CoA dehydrogenase
MIDASIDLVGECFIALVIHNEGGHFSFGANLGQLLRWATEGVWSEIESLLAQGQTTCRALKYAPFPVIGAPAGMVLGGGCEILLHCDAIHAHAETYLGLVECDICLLPG